MQLKEDEVIATAFCGTCGDELLTKSDSQYTEKIWMTCPGCNKHFAQTWENLQHERQVNTELNEKWLLAERRYNDLQDHLKAILF